jgi:hypothetical protein
MLQSIMPGLMQSHEKVGRSWIVTSSSEAPIPYRGISQSLTADELAQFPGQASSISARISSITPPFSDSSHVFDASQETNHRSTTDDRVSHENSYKSPASRTAPSFSHMFSDLKPYAIESGSMLYEALFHTNSHKHAAMIVSESILSWSGHVNALHKLKVGHNKVCQLFQENFSKFFGTGSS